MGLDVVETCTDKTVLAADENHSVVTLLALTPNEDGVLRADPVPMQPTATAELGACVDGEDDADDRNGYERDRSADQTC